MPRVGLRSISSARRDHRHDRTTGRVLRGRFQAFPLPDDDHLTTVLRYVASIPVRADLVARAEHWKWPSLGAGGIVTTTIRGPGAPGLRLRFPRRGTTTGCGEHAIGSSQGAGPLPGWLSADDPPLWRGTLAGIWIPERLSDTIAGHLVCLNAFTDATSPMTTALASPSIVPEQRLMLYGVEWNTYESLLHTLEGRHLRLNYDRGRLEIMVTGSAHERWKKLLARLLEVAAEEFDVSMLGQGNFTLKRHALESGLEVDDCWYISHESDVLRHPNIDLDIDPPPDLVIEIEVSNSLVDRLPLLAVLGVPEIWRYDGSKLTVLVRSADGHYLETETSPTFPAIPLHGFANFLRQGDQVKHLELTRQFRAWVRQFVREK